MEIYMKLKIKKTGNKGHEISSYLWRSGKDGIKKRHTVVIFSYEVYDCYDMKSINIIECAMDDSVKSVIWDPNFLKTKNNNSSHIHLLLSCTFSSSLSVFNYDTLDSHLCLYRSYNQHDFLLNANVTMR
jgi:hypothetical protein